MKSIIVDERIDDKCILSLERLGFNVLKLPGCKELPDAIRSHPDSLFFKHGWDLFTFGCYAESGLEVFCDLREYHRNIRLHFVSELPTDRYPEDCKINALSVKDKIFARLEGLCEGIRSFAKDKGLKLINTKQGYPACATLVFGDKRAITADEGLKRTLEKEGIETLLIKSGDISLPPYEYGFIGGASFVHRKTVYFFGDLAAHSDGARIEEFIKDAGYNIKSLGIGRLVDLGGALVFE